jgi:hypothetical protein
VDNSNPEIFKSKGGNSLEKWSSTIQLVEAQVEQRGKGR